MDDQVRTLLRKYWHVIDQLYHPESIWLFGSRAGMSVSPHSDIDLIVVSVRFANIRRLKRRSTFLRETGIAFDRTLPVVDPLCYTPEEFRQGLGQPTIVAEAVATGIELVGIHLDSPEHAYALNEPSSDESRQDVPD
ncbi:MAG: nucleotidyltransferase domain-containing protein [Anaerolineae bacterium]